MNLAQIERKSDERVEKWLVENRQLEARNFKAKGHASLEVMPYADKEMIFRQQGRRVSWGRHKARYVAARHYPNADCAKEIIDELVRRGAKNVIKEDEEQMKLF